MKKLWQNCHIATMQNGQYSYIEDAAIVTDGHLIQWIGKQQELPADTYSETLDFPVIGWPYAPAFAIGFMVFILVMMGYFPDSRPAIYVGITWLVLLMIAYRIWVKPQQNLGT